MKLSRRAGRQCRKLIQSASVDHTPGSWRRCPRGASVLGAEERSQPDVLTAHGENHWQQFGLLEALMFHFADDLDPVCFAPRVSQCKRQVAPVTVQAGPDPGSLWPPHPRVRARRPGAGGGRPPAETQRAHEYRIRLNVTSCFSAWFRAGLGRGTEGGSSRT